MVYHPWLVPTGVACDGSFSVGGTGGACDDPAGAVKTSTGLFFLHCSSLWPYYPHSKKMRWSPSYSTLLNFPRIYNTSINGLDRSICTQTLANFPLVADMVVLSTFIAWPTALSIFIKISSSNSSISRLENLT